MEIYSGVSLGNYQIPVPKVAIMLVAYLVLITFYGNVFPQAPSLQGPLEQPACVLDAATPPKHP